ncbi:MAG: hypothetical protein R3Y11_07305 [Pseudomonadota bacterium]
MKDLKGRMRVLTRIRSAELGHFGDCAPVGDGIVEMRIHYGAGEYIIGKKVLKYIGSLQAETRVHNNEI